MTEDLYTKTASETFGVPVEDVTGSQRRFAKAICFGKIYGGSGECRILKSNFETALGMALEYIDRQNGGGSTFAAGLRDVLEASRSGKRIVVRDE